MPTDGSPSTDMQHAAAGEVRFVGIVAAQQQPKGPKGRGGMEEASKLRESRMHVELGDASRRSTMYYVVQARDRVTV